MQELITIRDNAIGADTVQTVDARELHAFLQVGKDFSSWIKNRVSQYDFVEGDDFAVFTQSGENSTGRKAREYAVTLDMAKQLSMVERNEQGKKARLYFIECERRAKIAQHAIPDFEKLVEQSEQTRKLISSSSQQVSEIGRVIGGVTRNIVKEVDAKHDVTIRALGRLVNEYLVKRVILPVERQQTQVSRLERRLDEALSLGKRASHPNAIVWTEWLDHDGIYAMAKASPPLRGILSQQVTKSLDSWCKSTSNQNSMLQMHGKNVWHVSAVSAWLDLKGRALIQDHCSRRAAPSRDAA